MNQSDKQLINLIKEIDAKARESGMSKSLIETNLYILEKFALSIIVSGHLSTAYMNEILRRVAVEDANSLEILADITKQVEAQGFNEEITETVFFIIELFTNTANETKLLIKPYIQYYLRRSLAKALNCGVYAKPVNDVLGEEEENKHLGEIIAKEIIETHQKERKLGSSSNPIRIDEN